MERNKLARLDASGAFVLASRGFAVSGLSTYCKHLLNQAVTDCALTTGQSVLVNSAGWHAILAARRASMSAG